MAGSFMHVVPLKSAEDQAHPRLDLVNGSQRDMWQAIEELYAMIHHLTGGDRVKMFEAWRQGYHLKYNPASNADLDGTRTPEEFWRDNEGI